MRKNLMKHENKWLKIKILKKEWTRSYTRIVKIEKSMWETVIISVFTIGLILKLSTYQDSDNIKPSPNKLPLTKSPVTEPTYSYGSTSLQIELG